MFINSDSMDNYYPFYLSVDLNIMEIKSQLIRDKDVVAFFDVRNIICEEQIKTAIYRATRSFRLNKSIANQFNIELMLHLAGTHQIKIALQLFDIQHHTKEMIVIHRSNTPSLPSLHSGFPSFIPTRENMNKLGIKNINSACKEIISLGARLATDYE